MSLNSVQPTKKIVIDFNPKSNQFFFPLAGKTFPHPIYMSGYRYNAFDADYPLAAIGLREVKKVYPDCEATRTAAELIKQVMSTDQAIHDHALIDPVKNIFTVEPFPHQIDTVERMLHYKRLAILLEQGLGKTYISIMAMMVFKKLGIPHKTLIICPNIVFHSWFKEVEKYSKLKALPYKGNPMQRKECRDRINLTDWDCVITTFDMLHDRDKTNNFIYCELWKNIGVDQEKYAKRWQENGYITVEDVEVLLSNNTRPTQMAKMANILKMVPKYSYPRNLRTAVENENSNVNFLSKLSFNNLIVDEASKCLDRTSLRSNFVLELSRKADRTYLLSGTLCVGRPNDMYMPMTILSPHVLEMDWSKFEKKFCVVRPGKRHIIEGYKNLDVLKKMVDPFIIAKNRSECIKLPDRIFTKRYYELDVKTIDWYNIIVKEDFLEIPVKHYVNTSLTILKISKIMQLLSGFMYYDDYGTCGDCKNVANCVLNNIVPGSEDCIDPNAQPLKRKVFNVGYSPKLDLLEEDLSENYEKTIIWAWYQEDLANIRKLLNKMRIPFVSAGDDGAVEQFETDDKIRIFLGQTAQGIGITLNSATCTIYYSHGFALEPRLQSMDRNYRIGQNKSVLVKDYIAAGTLEELVVDLLLHKEDVKRLLQEESKCFGCERLLKCRSKHIEYLQPNCIYFNKRVDCEEKHKLILEPLEY